VVYFRAGYTPNDYPSDAEWDARAIIERSIAIKCPSLAYHLIGAKKMQQVLADDGVVERFVSSDVAKRLRASWTGLYSLDTEEEVKKLLPRVEADPHAFVMKPQREGGGNLLFGEKMLDALKNYQQHELSAYILMDRINTAEFQTQIVRNGQVHSIRGASELGVFSAYIGDGEREAFLDSFCGYLLRTKAASSEDGGVVAGVAVLDSVYLV
jgi:glutathione synthetase